MDIQRAFGITFLFVTHDQEEAMSLADRMSILEGGSFLQVGTPQTLYDQPADPFTASFLGEINRLEGTVLRQTGNQVTLSLHEAGALTALSDTPYGKDARLKLLPATGTSVAEGPGGRGRSQPPRWRSDTETVFRQPDSIPGTIEKQKRPECAGALWRKRSLGKRRFSFGNLRVPGRVLVHSITRNLLYASNPILF